MLVGVIVVVVVVVVVIAAASAILGLAARDLYRYSAAVAEISARRPSQSWTHKIIG